MQVFIIFCRRRFRWYRVISRTAPGVAAQKSFAAEPEAFDYAVNLDGFQHILRAAWLKAAAVGQQRRYNFLVEFNRQQKREFDHPLEHRRFLRLIAG